MAVRSLQGMLGATVVLIVAIAYYMHRSTQVVLDSDLSYTVAATALPLLSASAADRLVRIQANELEFAHGSPASLATPRN
ncbi:MAG: hypothetical protein HRT77_14165 [Halioglobus sp.]|nr:hypothetical protein [Halioglobus sp.]